MQTTLLLIAILGLAEFVVSCKILASSSGYYIGGLYSALASMCIGTFRIRTYGGDRNRPYNTDKRLQWLSVAAVACFVVNLIAAAIQGGQYAFMKKLQTCVDADGCYGQCTSGNVYYGLAVLCLASNADSQCSCVADGDTDDDSQDGCYNFNDMRSCKDFYYHTPSQLNASYALAIVATIVCAFLATYTLFKCCRAPPEDLRPALTEPLSASYADSTDVYTEAHVVTHPTVAYVHNPTITVTGVRVEPANSSA